MHSPLKHSTLLHSSATDSDYSLRVTIQYKRAQWRSACTLWIKHELWITITPDCSLRELKPLYQPY